MGQSNWSASLFYKEDADPSFLPYRFKLPDGSSRYASDCSLEDIHLAGFKGPAPQPPIPSEDTLEASWDSNSESWIFTPKQNISAELESKLCLADIKQRLKYCMPDGPLDGPEEYKEGVYKYRGHLFTLLHECEEHGRLLTYGDLALEPPDVSIPTWDSVKQRQINYFETEKHRLRSIYESQGAIPSPSNVLVSGFWEVNSVPDDWVLGFGPIAAYTLQNNIIPPSGYEIATVHIEPSGYYYIVPADSP